MRTKLFTEKFMEWERIVFENFGEVFIPRHRQLIEEIKLLEIRNKYRVISNEIVSGYGGQVCHEGLFSCLEWRVFPSLRKLSDFLHSQLELR